MSLIEKTKRMWIFILFLLAIIVSIQLYNISKKPSMAWITSDRYKSSQEPINVSLEEIMEFPALLNALENAEKNFHHTDAFSLNSSDADKLLDIIKSKSSYEIKPYVRNRNKILYRFHVRIIDKQQTYGVSISYQEKKPLIA
jgi:hypothetical protein